MTTQSTYTDARDNLAALLDRVEDDRDIVLITRRGHEDVALVAASELASLMETAHLLRSPENARRLLSALQRALRKKGKPQTVEDLRREMGLARP
jgi:antitoxin YefM